MNIKKIIIEDDNKNEIEFNITDGCGLFVTDDNKTIMLPSNNNNIKYNLIKYLLK